MKILIKLFLKLFLQLVASPNYFNITILIMFSFVISFINYNDKYIVIILIFINVQNNKFNRSNKP